MLIVSLPKYCVKRTPAFHESNVPVHAGPKVKYNEKF